MELNTELLFCAVLLISLMQYGESADPRVYQYRYNQNDDQHIMPYNIPIPNPCGQQRPRLPYESNEDLNNGYYEEERFEEDRNEEYHYQPYQQYRGRNQIPVTAMDPAWPENANRKPLHTEYIPKNHVVKHPLDTFTNFRRSMNRNIYQNQNQNYNINKLNDIDEINVIPGPASISSCEYDIHPPSVMNQLHHIGYFAELPSEITPQIVNNVLKYITYCPHLKKNLKKIPSYLIHFILNTDIDDLKKILNKVSQIVPTIKQNLIAPSFMFVKNHFSHDWKKPSTTRISPRDLAYFELKQFILGIHVNNRLKNLTPSLMKFIEEVPDLLKRIRYIFKVNNIPRTKVSPELVTLLLQFMINKRNNSVSEISPDLIDFLIHIDGAKNLKKFVLNWLRQNKESNKYPIYNVEQEAAYIELEQLIIDVTMNNKLNNMSPNLLKFLLKNPVLPKLVRNIFQKNNIPTTKINPQTVTLLLQLIKDKRTKKPVIDIPKNLMELVLNLDDVEHLGPFVNDWVSKNQKSYMMNIFLHNINANGGKYIPQILRTWLLTLPNGKQMLELLDKPGKANCYKISDRAVGCTKFSSAVVVPDGVPGRIRNELETFIQNLNNHQLQDVSPKLLKFLLHYPDRQKLINDIFQKNYIPSTVVNPQTVTSLLQLIIDHKTNTAVSDIPQSLIPLVLNLQGADNLVEEVLEWANKNNQPMMQIYLQILKANGGKDIPQVLRHWLLNSPNGKQTIELLEKPGIIECHPEPSGSVHCIKNVVPDDIKLKLTQFIKNLENKKLTDLSPNVLQFISNNPDLHPLIQEIFKNNNIPDSTLNPETVSLLLELIKDKNDNTPIKDIPESILELVLNMQGADKLGQFALNWVNQIKQPNMMAMFLQVIKGNGGKDIPKILRNWLLKLENGHEVLDFLETPGTIECHPESNNSVNCTKIVDDIPDEPLNLIPEDITLELKSFIENLNNNQLVDISPKLLQFILNNPDLQTDIDNIFQTKYIPTTTVNPQKVKLILQLIKDKENNTPTKDIPQSLIPFVLNLRGNEKLVPNVLDWAKKNNQPNMKDMFLQIIKANGNKGIPQFLRQWLLTLPNGQKELENLEKPGEVKCLRKFNGDFKCAKLQSPPAPEDIKSELHSFIQSLNDNKLADMSPNLLKFISTNPDLDSLTTDIFKKYKIPTTKLKPKTVTSLLQLIKDKKTHKPIKEVPQELMELVLKLKGAENLGNAALDWVSRNKKSDMIAMFLQIVKANGGKFIPEILRKWLLKFPEGLGIIEFLEKPGNVECHRTSNNQVKCIKTLLPTSDESVNSVSDESVNSVSDESVNSVSDESVNSVSDESLNSVSDESLNSVSDELQLELVSFIKSLKKNQLVDISPNLLQYISKNPDLHSSIHDIFQKNNLTTTSVNPETVTSLLQLIRDNKTGEKINNIPESLIELMMKLKGAENLGRVSLDWASQKKGSDLMQMVLQIIESNGGKVIPPTLRNWILLLPDGQGQKVLDFLAKPGKIKCTRESTEVAKCFKTVVSHVIV